MSEAALRPLRRVVITGLGVVAPNGIGKEQFWQACVSGQSGVGRITRFNSSMLPVQIAGEVTGFTPAELGLTAHEIQELDRNTQFAVAAANLALQDGGLTVAGATFSEEERICTGVYVGSAMASAEEGEKLWIKLTAGGTQPYEALPLDTNVTGLFMMHAPAMSIARHHRLGGPCLVIGTGCSAGSDAIGEAYRLIQEGQADRMLAGGSDAAITPLSLDVFCVIGALSTAHNDTPEKASRPYDNRRDGFVMAEGAGILLLEEREAAIVRGAHIYAEIVAFASNSSAYHMTALPQDGAPLQQLLKQVLDEGRMSCQQLDYINSHGSSTPLNEIAETSAYKAIFGTHAYNIPISATKSMIGHTQGAASAIEAVVTAMVIDRQVIPPTLNQQYPDPSCDLDYVPNEAREASVRTALTHSSGFGGINSALIFTQSDWVQ